MAAGHAGSSDNIGAARSCTSSNPPSPRRMTPPPPLPVCNPASRHSPSPAADTAPLTIYYNGHVTTVLQFPRDKAEAIMRMAKTGEVGSPARPREDPSVEGNQPQKDLPMARSKPMGWFLEKRKERARGAEDPLRTGLHHPPLSGSATQQQQQTMETRACERCGGGEDVRGFLGEWAKPPGFHFTPTGEELITQFLRKKAADVPLPYGLDHIIPTLPLFGPGMEADPRHLFQQLPLAARRCPLVQRHDNIFAFTEWERRSRSTRVAGPGTWHQNSRRPVTDGQGRILGWMAHLTFKIPETKAGGAHDDNARKPGPTTHWVMREFRLSDEADEEACKVGSSSNYKKDSKKKGRLVLCHIRYTVMEDKLKTHARAKPMAKDGTNGAVFDDDDDVEEGKGLFQYPKKRQRRGGGEGSLEQEEDVKPISAPAAVDDRVRPTTAYLAPAIPALDGSAGEPPRPLASYSCTQPSTPFLPTNPISRGTNHHLQMPPATAAAMPLYPASRDPQEQPPWRHTLRPLVDADVVGRPPMVDDPAAGPMDDARVLHATPPGGVMAAIEWDDIDLQMDEDMISQYCQLFFADSQDGDHGC